MPIVVQMICDTCHAVKMSTNHWYVVSLENNNFCIEPLALAADWATKPFSESCLQYFCGRSCAVEALTRWMTKLSKEETKLSPAHVKDAPIGRPLSEENSNERSYFGDQHNRSTLQGFPNRAHLEN